MVGFLTVAFNVPNIYPERSSFKFISCHLIGREDHGYGLYDPELWNDVEWNNVWKDFWQTKSLCVDKEGEPYRMREGLLLLSHFGSHLNLMGFSSGFFLLTAARFLNSFRERQWNVPINNCYHSQSVNLKNCALIIIPVKESIFTP